MHRTLVIYLSYMAVTSRPILLTHELKVVLNLHIQLKIYSQIDLRLFLLTRAPEVTRKVVDMNYLNIYIKHAK